MNIGFKRYAKRLRFLKNKPLLIPILIFNYIKIIIFKKKVLRSVELHIGDECQAKCEKCSALKIKNPNKKKITVNQIKDIISQCYNEGAINVGITGGEPLLNKDLFKILKVISTKRAIINLVTNGILLTKQNCIKLKQHGVDSIFVSIDTPVPEEHDANRKLPGSFNRAIQGVKNAKNAGLVTNVNTVFTPDLFNDGKLMKLKNLVLNELGVMWGIVYPALTGGWFKRYDLMLNKKQTKILEDLEKLDNVRNDRSDNYLEYGCPAGTEKIFISIYGDITPCACIPLSFGNVTEKPFKDIWEKMIQFPAFKKRSPLCNSAQNIDFIKKYIEPASKYKSTPVDIEKLNKIKS